MMLCAEHAMTWQEVGQILVLVGGVMFVVGVLVVGVLWYAGRVVQ